MVICADDVSHSAYVRVIEEGHNSSLSCGSDLFGVVCSFSVSVAMVFIGGLPWHNLDSYLFATNELPNSDIPKSGV